MLVTWNSRVGGVIRWQRVLIIRYSWRWFIGAGSVYAEEFKAVTFLGRIEATPKNNQRKQHVFFLLHYLIYFLTICLKYISHLFFKRSCRGWLFSFLNHYLYKVILLPRNWEFMYPWWKTIKTNYCDRC